MWKIKPKHHSFLDLLLEGSNPSDNWTYRDEDFVALWLHWQLFEVAATILTALALVFCRLFEDKPFLT